MKLNKNQLKEFIKHTMQEIKNNNPNITEEQLAEALPAVAARVLPMVARHMAADKAIDTVTKKDKEEVEEGKASAIKKVGKKVWDKVGPHVKDIAKDVAARAIEKSAEKAKDAIAKKMGSKEKDELKDESTIKKRRFTVKEVRMWMKKLEENRYKKVYNSDARRVAWMVNNEGVELSEMPKSMSKKWTKAQYGRERYLAKEFIKAKSEQMNEQKLRESIRNIIKRLI